MGDEKDKFKVAAEFYLRRGWNILPFNFKKAVIENGKLTKKASFTIDYGKYHTERVPETLIDDWWGDHNAIAVITGKISGITVMDIDSQDLPELKDLPRTFVVKTHRGFHYYFKYVDGLRTNAKNFKDGNKEFNIDIRNDGGIAYAAPSSYELPDGTISEYKVIDNSPLADFPIEWGRNIEKKYGLKLAKKDWKKKILEPIEIGSRNNDFASIIGGLLQRFSQDDWNGIVWSLVQSENKVQKEPLPDSELATIFNSIAKNEMRKRNIGGDIKDIETLVSDEEIQINITLEQAIVCFKVKNMSPSIMEGTVITWIKKSNGLTHEIPFYLKLNSDTNKEQWGRILGKAFDKKDIKEVYPWTLLVTKVSTEIEKKIREHKQDFLLSEVKPKEVTWMLEPFIQEDQINTFFGMGSSGKTLLSLYFSSVIAGNGTKTLLIDYENDSASWADKMMKIAKLGGNEDNYVYFDSEQIPLAEQVDKIKEVVKRHGIKLVIVDSASLSTGDSTSDEKATIRLVSAIKLLKTTTVLIAHQRKNEGDRNPIGSIQYENQSRNVWNFSSTPDNWDNSILHVACKHTKANHTYIRKEPIGFHLQFGQNEINISEESAMDNFENKYPIKTRIEQVLRDRAMKSKEIATELGISHTSCSKNLTEGKNKGMFVCSNGIWSLNIIT